jgi:hypothetical protein
MRAFLDGASHMLRQAWPEEHDAVPLGFRTPLVVGILPGALRGDGKDGEFRTAIPRLPLFRIGPNEADESYCV